MLDSLGRTYIFVLGSGIQGIYAQFTGEDIKKKIYIYIYMHIYIYAYI